MLLTRWTCAGSALLLCGAFFLARAQGSIDGYWLLKVTRDDDTIRKVFLNLHQQGSSLKGSISENYSAHDISNGTISDGKFKFEIHPWRTIVDTYEGSLEGNQLKVSFSHRNHRTGMPETREGVAERSTEAASKPPAPLPVPALHDVGDNGLVRTPPMGWNSWNHFATRVSDETVRKAADAIVATGMKDAGYIYVNIDDAWQGTRDAEGNIQPNKKFPDMKGLADYVHSKGLKIGLYSSPGPYTCGGYEGSFGHEKQDAESYAKWGFDFLKYDWCSAGSIYKDKDLRPVYQKMGDALKATGRPIVFSLCEYGKGDVWKWGGKVGGNSWRTTGDIADNWKSLEEIGFRQIDIAQYPNAGHWNDPDMLEVGNGGMTKDEYQTHMTLWALLSSPLLAGNDLDAMTDETKKILLNREVIAINQDAAVHHPKKTSGAQNTEIWTRELTDGSSAVAMFNRGESAQPMTADLSKLGLSSSGKAHDLWSDTPATLESGKYTATVPSHGVVLLKISKS